LPMDLRASEPAQASSDSATMDAAAAQAPERV